MSQYTLWDNTQISKEKFDKIWKNLVNIRNASYGKPDKILQAIAHSEGLLSESQRKEVSSEEWQNLIDIGWVNEHDLIIDSWVYKIIKLGYNTFTREAKEPIKEGLYPTYESARVVPDSMPKSGITEDD